MSKTKTTEKQKMQAIIISLRTEISQLRRDLRTARDERDEAHDALLMANIEENGL